MENEQAKEWGISDLRVALELQGSENEAQETAIGEMRMAIIGIVSALPCCITNAIKTMNELDDCKLLQEAVKHAEDVRFAKGGTFAGLIRKTNAPDPNLPTATRQQQQQQPEPLTPAPPQPTPQKTPTPTNQHTTNQHTTNQHKTSTNTSTNTKFNTATSSNSSNSQNNSTNNKNNTTHQNSWGQEHWEEIYAERRAKNIIFKGIPETTATEDELNVCDILTYLSCENRIKNILNSFRLGSEVQGRNRLLMVTFDNDIDVNYILRRSPKLADHYHMANIYMFRDLPRSERKNRRRGANATAEAAHSNMGSNGYGYTRKDSNTAPASRTVNSGYSTFNAGNRGNVHRITTPVREFARSLVNSGRTILFGTPNNRDNVENHSDTRRLSTMQNDRHVTEVLSSVINEEQGGSENIGNQLPGNEIGRAQEITR